MSLAQTARQALFRRGCAHAGRAQWDAALADLRRVRALAPHDHTVAAKLLQVIARRDEVGLHDGRAAGQLG